MPIQPNGRLAARALAHLVLLLGLAVGPLALAAAPLLDIGPLPRGEWRLIGVDDDANPWPRVEVTLEVDEDGRGFAGSTGCNRFSGEAGGTADDLDLGVLALTRRACMGDEANAEAIVSRVLGAAERADLISGRLLVRGASRTLAYAPVSAPIDPGISGAPPVTSSDPLDPTRFATALEASAANRAAWVRDPLQVALLFVDEPSSGSTTVVREDAPGGEAARVVIWFDEQPDDSVRATWFEVRLERGDDAAWRIDSGERASWCRRGEVTDELVGGLCP
jgi:heat shock protein HslJ